jgi:hypothetical protein
MDYDFFIEKKFEETLDFIINEKLTVCSPIWNYLFSDIANYKRYAETKKHYEDPKKSTKSEEIF